MKKYFVIGNPIDHSLSPQLHNYWLKKNNINGVYDKKKLDSNDLKDLVLKIKNNEINGLNITVPFKNEIIPYLDELSNESKSTQSVNTIYSYKNKIIGHNTDIDGFELAIKNTGHEVNGKKILILGAGGVVPSIIFALNKMGASEIILSNRTKHKAETLKKLFKNLSVVDWGQIPYFDMIVNATSLGLNNNENIFLHRGIAGRAFKRSFQLADHIKIMGANLSNGLLNVELVREIPEELKPRKIEISSSPKTRIIQAA